MEAPSAKILEVSDFISFTLFTYVEYFCAFKIVSRNDLKNVLCDYRKTGKKRTRRKKARFAEDFH